MKIKVDTKVISNEITQEAYYEDTHTKLRQEISRYVINLQDKGVRDALISLGWTPPKTIDPPEVDFGERTL